MRALVCGSRDWADRDRLDAVLNELSLVDPIDVLIEGGARGADTMAKEWAQAHHISIEEYPADWDRFRGGLLDRKNPAGAIRNRTMLRLGNPDMVIAFSRNDSPGTGDMIQLARDHEIPVYIVREGTP